MDTPVVEIERVRHCDRCRSEQMCRLVRNITASGVSQVYWLCLNCNKNIKNPGTAWISHDKLRSARVNIEALPVVKNHLENGEPCAVCGVLGTELHHWAPYHLFKNDPDVWLWPTAWLCREHHQYWHKIVTPNMSKR